MTIFIRIHKHYIAGKKLITLFSSCSYSEHCQKNSYIFKEWKMEYSS